MNKNNETAKRVRGLGKALRLGLYITLALSALITFVGLPALQSRVQAGQLGPGWLLAPSIAFGVALGVYLLDRIFLIRYRHYPPGRALFQIAFGLIFMFLLFPSSLAEYRQLIQHRPAPNSLMALMKHSDPRVRSLAFEVAAYRKNPQRFVSGLAQGLLDKNPQAARRAQASLQRISGQHFALGVLPDPGSLKSKVVVDVQADKPIVTEDAGLVPGAGEDAATAAGGGQ